MNKSSNIRRISGLSKSQFITECIKQADLNNPSWRQDIFSVYRHSEDETTDAVSSLIWTAQSAFAGFALSRIGVKFFESGLNLIPYYINSEPLTSRGIVDLDKLMPWPYATAAFPGMTKMRIAIYSSEVAVWAALYDNDLDKLLDAYARK